MLHNLNFTASQMAEQFQCSVQLIYKSLYDAGLKQRTRYSNLDDTALDEKIHELQDQYPNAGSVVCACILLLKTTFVQCKFETSGSKVSLLGLDILLWMSLQNLC